MKASIYFLLFILFACKPTTTSGDSSTQAETISPSVEIINDTVAMTKTVKEFLTWYKNNYTQTNSFGFTYQDKQGNYHVSVQQGEEYLKYLKSSGYISDVYVNLWMQYFKDKSDYLEKNPQNEGPPEGFEFDLVLITQEPELVFKEIEKMKCTAIERKGDKAILQIDGLGYNIDLSKENGKWMIEYIATENYD